MWITSDGSSLYPVLVEIETPHKAWFYGDLAEIHSDFTHAHGQLAEWRAWFDRGHNRTAFLDYYEIPPAMARRRQSGEGRACRHSPHNGDNSVRSAPW